MNRLIIAAVVLLSCIGLTACDDSTAPTASSATYNAVPNPAPAIESTGVTYTITGDSTHPDQILAYPWKTSFTVNITETAGVGRKTTNIVCVVQQATGGIPVTPTGSDKVYYRCDPHASGNRLDAKGSMSVSFDVWYALPNNGREALVTAGFTYLDDNGSQVSESTDVQVR